MLISSVFICSLNHVATTRYLSFSAVGFFAVAKCCSDTGAVVRSRLLRNVGAFGTCFRRTFGVPLPFGVGRGVILNILFLDHYRAHFRLLSLCREWERVSMTRQSRSWIWGTILLRAQAANH